MKKEPLVSIGLPVFNGEKYLVKSLNSLINQTYHKIEIIICDDNSNDSSFEICKNYENKNKNIKSTNAKIIWAKHPSRIHQNNMGICTFCNSPTPKGEIKRWGKCAFCWRKINN